MYKPTFGQTPSTGGFSGFSGAANSSPFGQTSVFGKTQTTGFGQPAFGTAGSSGLFGSTIPSSTPLFGSTTAAPAFGQPQTTQPSFGFGTPAQQTTNLFGAQPTTGTGLFGASTNSAFGQNKPAFGSTFGAIGTTGTTTGLFGAQATNQTATPLFGAAPTGTATPFGASTSNFGVGAQQSGTVVKFNPITGTDTLQKGPASQQINTRHFCITCMKEYENKSLEELRFEDYSANRKGPQQSGLFGQTTTQPTLFGAAPTTGLFGNQPTENKPLFGSTSTTLGGFGTSGGGVFGQQAAPNTSLFGAKPTGFGTTTASSTGFGFGTNTNSLFNNAAQKPFGATTTPSLFGQTTTQPATAFGATTGFSGFGQQQPQQQPQNNSIGLFGQQNKFNLGATTTPSSGFSFGQTSTTGTNLFGAKPATTGFGTTGFGATGNTFGAPSAGTNLFNKPAPLSFNFGGTTTNTGTGINFNNSTSLFGNNQQKPGGLFGTTGATTGGLFGSTGFGSTGTGAFGGAGSTGLGGSSLGSTSFFGTAPAAPAAAPAHSAILALASMPFAASPLFKNLLPAIGKSDLKPANAVTQKAMQASKDLKVSPASDTKIKLKPMFSSQSKKSLFEGLDETTSPALSCTSIKKLTDKPRGLNHSLTENLTEAVTNKENRRVSFSLPLETPRSADRDKSDSDGFYIRRNPLFKPNALSPQYTMNELEPAASSTVVEAPEDCSSHESENISSPKSSSEKGTSKDASNVSSAILDNSGDCLSDSSHVDEGWVPHPTGIILRRLDYYTIPSLEELEPLVAEDGSCIVENFCIGRHGYGNLYFEDTMDVAGLDIDTIVHFRHTEVTVYPDESIKPPVGEGLNRKCQVTLEQIWPLDKATREIIRDAHQLQEMGYEDKLRRKTNNMKAHFMEYRPLTGSWVFRVDHFSKYGLQDDSDEEDEVIPVKTNVKVPAQAPVTVPTPTATALKAPPTTVLSPILPIKKQCLPQTDSHNVGKRFFVPDTYKGSVEADVDMDEAGDDVNMDDDALDSPWSPDGKVDAHTVQLMKSSFFHCQVDDVEEQPQLQQFSGLNLSRNMPSAALTAAIQPKGKANLSISLQLQARHEDIPSLAPPPVNIPRPRPKTVSVRHPVVIPVHQLTVGKIGTRFITDCTLTMGRSCKVGWGPSSRFVSLTSRPNYEHSLKSHDECDPLEKLIEDIPLYPQVSTDYKEAIENHLLIQLENSILTEEGDCPLWSPVIGVEALHRHCLLATELADTEEDYLTYSRQVWQLCAALWGKLPALPPQEEPTSHRSMMMRKEALTEWLRECAEPVEGAPSVNTAFAHLSGYNLPKACEQLQSKGDHYTSLLLCSGQVGKSLLQEQLKEWTDVGADKFIEPERLRLYTVASGLPVLQCSQDILNACAGLNWRTVFALHYWFMSSPVATISEVLKKYEEAFSGPDAYADKPFPPYDSDVKTSSGQVLLDLCYHLLKLYSNRSHPLERLLNPATHTDDALDCRLSWLLEQVLSSLGYIHLSALSSGIICMSFAAQLEALGLWQWAVFVCSHLKDKQRRKQAILDLLGRHVVVTKKLDLSNEETFVTHELSIPAEWVYRAKATRAMFMFLYDDAAFYLIQAAEWNEAHRVFIHHIAPDLVINEKFAYLQELLVQLQPHATSISEWPHQGQLLLDFLDIRRIMNQALEERDAAHLEEKLPLLASICDRVLRWPTLTVKHRLCQAEIAKRVAHIYINVKRYDRSISAFQDARSVISKLPLPEDYLDDLKELLNQAGAAPF